ncbi:MULTISPECIES: L,D-transpeptidase [unclassified Beijerinckia]|uniref:L,D-transpeptidase n=1 Tax=unclassified Beijerinckia TaxID=2638183 RepID=UPI000896C489|nr:MULTISPECIES: L,D-transpeptidase [unclassified Beijerinckia]MDH7796573.1 lipoprotein-anchoring transpeptidase ErfK/SrfK [Beijerinckia sp. GAS462]SEC50860.1 L,D-transpeptidase catalytic domain [Beijerinckia sp. 28-YEA-48]
MSARFGAVSALALALAGQFVPFAVPAALAGGMNDTVIRGVGPAGDLPAIQPYAEPVAPRQLRRTSSISAPRPPHGVVANQPYGPGADPRPYQVAASRGYGGGFIELLVTGRDPTPRRGYNEPLPMQPAYQQAPVYQQAPYQQAYAPDPRAEAPVRRAVDPIYLKQEVAYDGPHAAGTIVVDTPRRFLFLVLGNGRALRYGIGVGRPGFSWAGMKTVSRKAEWPNWTPPPEMLKRRPDLPRFMKGGEDNPLGARALYLGSSLYRIHGTNEPYTIGTNVSSGCIRMMNEDVIDLYGRVGVGTKVIVI